MAKEIDLLDFSNINCFNPTNAQLALKMMIHDKVSPQILGRITKNQLDILEPYIAPYTLEDIERWNKTPGFFLWLLLPDTFQIEIQKAKQQAVEAVKELMELDMYDSPSEDIDTTKRRPKIDPKLAAVKLKAAELILRTDIKREQRIQNTIKVTQHLPKHLLNKSTEALEAELRYLKKE